MLRKFKDNNISFITYLQSWIDKGDRSGLRRPVSKLKYLEINRKCEITKMQKKNMNTFNRPVNNGDILESALNFWIEGHVQDQDAQTFPTTLKKLKNKKDASENMFISTMSCIQKLTEIAEHHGRNCKNNLKQKKISVSGSCDNCDVSMCKYSSLSYIQIDILSLFAK